MSISWRCSAALACVGLLAADGCSEPKVSLAPGAREYVASDYPLVLNRWTRTQSLIAIEQLDELLTVTATFESWDFRWAYVVRYAEDYRMTVEQRRALLERTLGETQEAHNFYVALYGDNRRENDLSRAKSAWIVRLIDEQGNETAPEKIELIKTPGALERTYFPYTSVWRLAFRLQFPRATADGRPTISPTAKWFGLRFAGAQGNEELHWDVQPGPTRQASLDEPSRIR